jgi:hypothetical protein
MMEVTKKQLQDILRVLKKNKEYENMDDAVLVEMLLKDEINWNILIDNLRPGQRFPALCMAAIMTDGQHIKYVPKQTPELCMMAVKQNGMALSNVHRRYLTPELYRAAITQNGGAIAYLEEKRKTPELCKLAIEGPDGDWAMQFIKQTPELCREAVKRHGRSAINHVKDVELRKRLQKEFLERKSQ